MRGLMILSDPQHAQMYPEHWFREAQRLNMKVQWETAESVDPPLLSALQLHLSRLTRRCSWICILAEGDLAAHALILAAQLNVDRLILIGDAPFRSRHPDRRRRRLNAFALRNLSLITAEIIAVGMGDGPVRRLSSALGFCSGGLICVSDAAELWRKHETFLTAPFSALSEPSEHAK